MNIPVLYYESNSLATESEEGEEEEPFDIISALESLGDHEHCVNCFNMECSYSACPLESCKCCAVRMHACKNEDHSTICKKAVVPCINNEYGCSMTIRRDKMSTHLEKCPASVVVCGREGGRRAVSDIAKLRLKKWGKGHEEFATPCVSEAELDVQLALRDQDQLIESYGYSRQSRVRRRDGLNKKHPVVPLRELFDDNGGRLEKLPPASHECGDSSDEERAEEEKKMQKQRAMFANCWMCQYDPSSQHLHTLGNENAKFRRKTKKRKTIRNIGPFYEERNLMVSLMQEFIPECVVKSDNIFFLRQGGTLYTNKCLKVIRRDQLEDHYQSQHEKTQDRLQCMIVRCPLWHNGCPFITSRLKLRNGRLRFLRCVDSFVVSLNSEHSIPLGNTEHALDSLPVCILEEIFSHLSPVNLMVLTMVSKTIRSVLFDYFRHRAAVTPVWTKYNKKWTVEAFKWEFCSADYSREYVFEPCASLSEHIGTCAFSDRIEWDTSRVPIFPADLLSPIMGSAVEAKDDLYVLPDHLRRPDMPIPPDSHHRIRPDDWEFI